MYVGSQPVVRQLAKPGSHRRGEAIARVLRERLRDDRVELLAHLLAAGLQRRDHRLQVVREDLRRRAGEERRLVREQLVQNDADGVDVRREARRRAADHLGRHVLGRAADRAVVRIADTRHEARDAEVDDLHDVDAGAPLVEDDVVGLQVRVDHAGEVRFLDARE